MLLLNSTITLQRPLSMKSYKYVSVRRKALCTSFKFCFCSGSAFVLPLLCTSCKLYLCFRFFLISNYHYKVTQSPYFSLYLSLAIIYLIMLLRVFPLKDLLMARNILILNIPSTLWLSDPQKNIKLTTFHCDSRFCENDIEHSDTESPKGTEPIKGNIIKTT